jgi:phosphohistidine phosphatase
MRIYLVRHGDAKPETDDRARPLSDRGRREIEQLARTAADRGVQATEIRHSGLLRARQTAEILAGSLRPRGGVRETLGLAPNDDPDIAQAECESAWEPIVLVGHLPHLGRLNGRLTGNRAAAELKTGSMVCLARTDRAWEVEWRI